MARALSWAERMKLEKRAGRRGARALAHVRVAQALEPALLALPPPDLPQELVGIFQEELKRLIGRAAPELVEPAPKLIEAIKLIEAEPLGAAEPSMPE
jgi:hypothetical protein